MDKLVKLLNKKYNVGVFISKRIWCMRDSEIRVTWYLFIEGHGTKFFKTKEELIEYAKNKMSEK